MASLPEPRAGHALVVGGTGMLAPVARSLAAGCAAVSVVARPSKRLVSLVAQTRGTGVAVDWRDDAALRAGIASAVAVHGPIALVVCWTHSDAPRSPLTVADAVADPAAPPRFFQIYGGSGDASQPVKRDWHRLLSQHRGLRYRRVSLWAEGARWLSDPEIASGILEAVTSDRPDTEVRPRDARS